MLPYLRIVLRTRFTVVHFPWRTPVMATLCFSSSAGHRRQEQGAVRLQGQGAAGDQRRIGVRLHTAGAVGDALLFSLLLQTAPFEG